MDLIWRVRWDRVGMLLLTGLLWLDVESGVGLLLRLLEL